jgi:zinc and cadmium transporter
MAVNWMVPFSIGLVSLLSGAAMWRLKPGRSVLRLLLAFTGAYLLSVALLHILPEIYQGKHHDHSLGWWILGGFLAQVVLETFSGGLNHAHPVAMGSHSHNHGFPVAGGISLIFGLYTHAFLEGLPLYARSSIADPLVLSIILHTVPVSASFILLMGHAGFTARKMGLLLLGFALMVPMGSYLGWGLESLTESLFKEKALALTVGIFLHIATTILFEAGENHRIRWQRALFMGIGVFVAWLTLLVH